MLRELTAAGAEYVIIGGYAVAAWGHQRATKDLDILVRPSVDNARKVLAALAAFGAPLHDLVAEDLSTPGTFFQVGVPPLRIDIINDTAGITFDDAVRETRDVDFGGVLARVIGLDALLKNKRAVGRAPDRMDVKALERIHSIEKAPAKKARRRKR
jgi:predicted nucleotidyltransferase